MKKIILLVLSLASVFAVSRLVQNRAEAEEANDVVAEELNALFTSYRNNGYYTKHTVINVDTNNEALVKDIANYFHASVNHTERTTYYYNDTLWMSQDKEGDEVGYVVYGTSYDAQGQANGVTRGVVSKRFEHPTDAKVVLSGEGKNSMDQYYVTLTDMVVTADQGWTLDGGVYTTTNEAVIENYINFTAPLWLTTEEASNYVDYTKATAQVVGGKLVMKLWVSTTELEGKLVEGSEVDGDHAVFSTATVSGLPGAIAIFDFENGLANTGTDSSIYGALVGHNDGEMGKELDVDSNSYIFTSYSSYQLGSKALKVSHHQSRPAFGVKGIDFNTNDFTISVKIRQTADYITNLGSTDVKNFNHYLFGTAMESNKINAVEKPCFNFRLGDPTKSAAYNVAKLSLNSTQTMLFTNNTSGYFKAHNWIDYRIVKQGTKVHVSVVIPKFESTAKIASHYVTFELSSVEDLMITSDMVLGFGMNFGSTRPGNDSYYDDIYVWDYAVPEFLN